MFTPSLPPLRLAYAPPANRGGDELRDWERHGLIGGVLLLHVLALWVWTVKPVDAAFVPALPQPAMSATFVALAPQPDVPTTARPPAPVALSPTPPTTPKAAAPERSHSARPITPAAQPPVTQAVTHESTWTAPDTAASPAPTRISADTPALLSPPAARTSTSSTAATGQAEPSPTRPTLGAATAAPTAPAAAAAVTPATIAPSAVQYLVPPQPEYPRQSRRQGESGRVMLRVLIDIAGWPQQVQVSTPSGFIRLDDAARAALQRARFKPYTEHGQPTPGWTLVPIDFELEK